MNTYTLTIVISIAFAFYLPAVEIVPQGSDNNKMTNKATDVKVINDDGWIYLRMNTFQATVEKLIDIPLNPNEVHYSGASNGLEIDLRISERTLKIYMPITDVGWRWAHNLRKLEIGKTYEFNGDKKFPPKLIN